MPRLPGSQDVQRVEMRSDPGVRAPGKMYDASGLDALGGALSDIGERIRKRDENLQENLFLDEFQRDMVALEHQAMKGNLESDDFLNEYHTATDKLMQERLSKYSGSMDSKARILERAGRIKQGSSLNLMQSAFKVRDAKHRGLFEKGLDEARVIAQEGDFAGALMKFQEKYDGLRAGMADWEAPMFWESGVQTLRADQVKGLMDKAALGAPEELDRIQELLNTDQVMTELKPEVRATLLQNIGVMRGKRLNDEAETERFRRQEEIRTNEKLRFERELQKIRPAAGAAGPKFGSKEFAAQVRMQAAPFLANGAQLDPDSDMKLAGILSESLVEGKDQQEYPVFKNASVGELNFILNSKFANPHQKQLAQNTLNSGGASAGGATVELLSRQYQHDSIAGLSAAYDATGRARVGIPAAFARGIEQVPIFSPDQTATQFANFVEGVRDVVEKAASSNILGRRFSQDLMSVKQVFQFNPKSFWTNEENRDQVFRDGHKHIYKLTNEMNWLLAHGNLTLQEKQEVTTTLHQFTGIMNRIVPTYRTPEEAARLTKDMLPNTEIFIAEINNFVRVGDVRRRNQVAGGQGGSTRETPEQRQQRQAQSARDYAAHTRSAEERRIAREQERERQREADRERRKANVAQREREAQAVKDRMK